LLVAIDSDRRIAEKKGLERPFNNETTRFVIMQNLKSVDEVVVFDSNEELENIIRTYHPDIMVVGSDWKGKNVIGANYSKEVDFFERTNNESTTNTIESFINRRQLY